MTDAVKRFPGVVALDGVDLTVKAKEIHALVGENGAGKSSLVKSLAGIYALDDGIIRLGGEEYSPPNPQAALASGVRIVHQEFSNMPDLSIAENLFFEQLPRRLGFVDYKRLNGAAATMLDMVGLALAPQTKMNRLSLAQTQLVEIARALSERSRLIIFDEPTASLTALERGRLFELILKCRDEGTAVIYISHHLDEVFEICDTATVMRDGRNVGTHPVSTLSSAELVTMMVGRDLANDEPFPADVSLGKLVLEVNKLKVRTTGCEVSFNAHAGEIVGVAGLTGAGRTETMRALFGADRSTGGTIRVGGKRVRIRNPRDAIRAGISLATEDRKNQGLVLPMGTDLNITLADIQRVSTRGWLLRGRERRLSLDMIRQMRIKVASPKTPVGTLSGGNQQKVVLARWLFRNTQVLILDEPTRGIDVGARHDIYNLIATLARQGRTVVVVSSDLPELMGICHRILVFSKGQITGSVKREDFNQERILALAYKGYMRNKGTSGAHLVPPAGHPLASRHDPVEAVPERDEEQ